MKVYPEENELYPCYSLKIPPPEWAEKYSFEVDEETVLRWKKAAEAFFQAQAEIEARIHRRKHDIRLEAMSEEERFEHLLWTENRATFNGVEITKADNRKLVEGMVVFGRLKQTIGLYTIKELHSRSCIVSNDTASGWMSYSNILGFPA